MLPLQLQICFISLYGQIIKKINRYSKEQLTLFGLGFCQPKKTGGIPPPKLGYFKSEDDACGKFVTGDPDLKR